ncbi:hypothetical protein EVAR_78610_1 [Eumeta japonica]|uniref:Uncharacterized protein n=1 Tax=Eumeta variegata TaxID=151549 RepID=A0A4C1U927_EUMVA|nr:hypothetical protein EVAR_78610_1 [Eumeta japonica]
MIRQLNSVRSDQESNLLPTDRIIRPAITTNTRNADEIYETYRATIPRHSFCRSNPAERKEKEEEEKAGAAEGADEAGEREEEQATQIYNSFNAVTSATMAGSSFQPSIQPLPHSTEKIVQNSL